MKRFLLQIFTWWNGQTLGTRWFTFRKGRLVGSDLNGNRYYTDRRGERRWVIYAGLAEPSLIPPGWHGWIHHTVDTPPPAETYLPRDWEKTHRPNLTGTPFATRPAGSLLGKNQRQPTGGDYEPWTP